MQEFIAAMRQFRRPIAGLAVLILVLQALVAGLATAAAAARVAGFDAGILCHGTGEAPSEPGSNSSPPAHDCCVYCTVAAPAALTPKLSEVSRVEPFKSSARLPVTEHVTPTPRAIRAGPSQAPPVAA